MSRKQADEFSRSEALDRICEVPTFSHARFLVRFPWPAFPGPLSEVRARSLLAPKGLQVGGPSGREFQVGQYRGADPASLKHHNASN